MQSLQNLGGQLSKSCGSEVQLELTQDEALQIAALLDIGLKTENDKHARQIQDLSRALEQSKEAEHRVVVERDHLAQKISALQLDDPSIHESSGSDSGVKAMWQRGLKEPHTAAQQAETDAASAVSPKSDFMRELRKARAEAAAWKKQYLAMEREKLKLQQVLRSLR